VFFSKAEAGLNFAELAVSILVLGTVLIMIIGIFIGGIAGMQKSENHIVVTNSLTATLEQYSRDILSDFDNPLYGDGLKYKIAGEHTVDNVKVEEKWVEFGETGTAVRNRMKSITVTIYWWEKNLEGSTGKRKKTFSTCVNNYLTY